MGPIQTVLGDHIIAATGLSRYATVSSIIRHGRWRWPWINTMELREIREIIFLQPPPYNGEQDAIKWEHERSGIFTIRSAWESIRSHKERVEWFKLIWFPGRIPKAALWSLVSCERSTRDTGPPSQC